MHPQAKALFFEGTRLIAAGDHALALNALQQACTLDPALAEGWANLALVLDQLGDKAGAEQAYRRALDAGCDAFELHLNFGALLTTQKHFDEAFAHYACGLRQNPGSAALWSNLGALYLALQHDEDALTCLEKALQLQSDHASAHLNLAYFHLRRGEFEPGWRALENRDWYQTLAAQMPCPRWRGEALQGQSLVLAEHAGHGDVIQFVRYAPLLKAMGTGHVTLICHPALVALMHTVKGLDAVVSSDSLLPAERMAADFWTPLLSLPFYLQTRAETIPAGIPYLQADPLLMAQWGARLGAPNRPTVRVGLVWKGNPAFENDRERSLPHFDVLQALLDVPRVAFYSLQKGVGQDEPEALNAARGHQRLYPYPVESLGAELHTFADTAALIRQLDLVISVDTAVAHLAGALGVSCWVLLPDTMADWRWGINGGATACQSAWYPQSMRLWRQARGNNWQPVIESVAAALRNFTAPTA